jgi:hypothetical protein
VRVLVNFVLVLATAAFAVALWMRIGFSGESPTVTRLAGTPTEIPEYWRDLGREGPGESLSLAYFFDVYCPWSRASGPAVAALSRSDAVTAHGVELAILGWGDAEAVTEYGSGYGVDAPILPQDEKARELVQRWGAWRVPHLVLLSPDGRVIASWTGLVDGSTIEDVVQRISSASTPDPSRS